ncbi:hypothetical protein QFZ40_000504 [Arthrobacter pascens]|nr:hypothetical protein [Arthrobacter pascens]
MTSNPNNLSAAPDSRRMPEAEERPTPAQTKEAGGRGNVVEIYPGASSRRLRRRMRTRGREAGMATAEYAIATLAAVGFAGLLVFILRSDEVRGFLLNLIRTALALP